MTANNKNDSGVKHFWHPTAGEIQHDLHYLAIRWRTGASKAARTSLLAEADLALAGQVDDQRRPLLQVNQTDGLSWVVANQLDKPIDSETIRRLETSSIVEWVSMALRSVKNEAAENVLFTVNPTRFYIKEQAVARAGGLTALSAAVNVDSTRASLLPGWTAVRLDNVSAAQGHTAIEVAQTVNASLKTLAGSSLRDAIRFENIPFLSPVCHVERCAIPMTEFSPNDPMFAQQWGLQRIGIPRAWEIARGSSDITVAVIDEGVELTHPDLNMHENSWNASTDTPDGSPTGNHGTACAGIIGAQFDNAQGVAGAASGVRIMAIATATWADVDIAEGLYFASDHGARIVSMSFGVYASWNFWDFDIVRDALQHAHTQGLLLVAASGNENSGIARFPGSDSRTLCVGGSNRSDERKRIGDSSSENWWGASYGPDLDVVAPCLEMPTTDRLGAAGYSNTDYYESFNGTSSATPLVAGLSALILSIRPSLTNVEVRHIVQSTCDKVSPSLYSYSLTNAKPSGTWNNEVGYGRVNAERALLAACANNRDQKQDCSGCDSDCIEQTPAPCRGPVPLPWLSQDRCMYFYEMRVFDSGLIQDRFRLQFRVTYQHSLCLLGRQQGPLLYTTTLLPGEELRIHEYDRYRRVRSETQRVSVHTSFRQTISAMSQMRRSSSASAYVDSLNSIRTNADTSVSAGGGLAGFFGAPQGKGEFGVDTETTIASGASAHTASEQFSQFAITSSQAMEAERSLVISTFEDEEHRTTTARTLKNHNHCYAVTYYVRRVNEVYSASTRIESVEWRIGDSVQWRSIHDIEGLPDNLRQTFEQLKKNLPRVGEVVHDKRPITIPTDGTLYETELAHCSSCEPVRGAEELVNLEYKRAQSRKACLEADLLELELNRRRKLAQTTQPVALELNSWPFDSESCAIDPACTGDYK